jgi:hypothetical protein
MLIYSPSLKPVDWGRLADFWLSGSRCLLTFTRRASVNSQGRRGDSFLSQPVSNPLSMLCIVNANCSRKIKSCRSVECVNMGSASLRGVIYPKNLRGHKLCVNGWGLVYREEHFPLYINVRKLHFSNTWNSIFLLFKAKILMLCKTIFGFFCISKHTS